MGKSNPQPELVIDPITSFQQKTSQPSFDKEAIQRWTEKAPEYYSQFEGVIYKGTRVLNRKEVQYLEEEQVRQLKIIMENVPALQKAFVNGIDYNEQPPSVEKVSDHEYNGRSGWTRDLCFDQLGWKHYFYDILEFVAPRFRRRYMAATNRTFLPRVGNTYGDIFRVIRDMIDTDMIKSEEEMIREEVQHLYVEGSDSDRDNMVGELMSTAGIPIGNYRTYHSKKGMHSTQQWAEDNNAPWGGDKNTNLPDRVGYVMHSPTAEGTWLQMIKSKYELSEKLNRQVQCESRAYIKNPRPGEFDIQRKDFNNKRQLTQEKLENVIRSCVSIDENGEIQVDLGIKWSGFLPQDLSNDPNNNGLDSEIGEVDELGNPFKG